MKKSIKEKDTFRKRHIYKNLRKFAKTMFIIGIIVVALIVGINYYVLSKSSDYIYTDFSELERADVIIVLGAFVREDDLSMVLKDRVEAGVDLYENGNASRLLFSGDHGRDSYDEVNAIRRYVMENTDIPEKAIFLDHAGFDTYDSMYRARDVFQVRKVIIVTQEFHINRAVYTARELGIDAYGFSVNQDKYRSTLQFRWFIRETLARVKAVIDLANSAKPTFLGDEIPISGDGRSSWDEFD